MDQRTEIRKHIEDLENKTPHTKQDFEDREDQINLLLDQLINPMVEV